MRYNWQILNLSRICLIVVAILMSYGIATAQSIANVDANQEGKAIAVTYDLSEKADIALYVTQDGGKTKTAIPLVYTVGDVGKKVSPGSDKKILWKVLDQYPNQNFQGENMSFIVKGKPSMRFFAMLNMGYSFDSGFNLGVSIGQVGFIGWYVKAMTTLSFPKATDYTSDENGYVDGILPAYSGVTSKSKFYGLAGINIRLGAPVYLNAGLGYGSRYYSWETTDRKWIKNAPGCYSGLAIDAGVMGRLKSILLSFSATLIGKNVDVNVGVGYVF